VADSEDAKLNRETTILIKAWETFQNIAESNGKASWTIRAWGISVWCALIAYSYAPGPKLIAWIGLVQLAASFLMELATRQVQYAFISKSIRIEQMLQSIALGERPAIPEGGISTNIDTPTLGSLFQLLALRRWLIWFPYLVLFLTSALVASS
jgi:hypothetical protein